MSISVALMSQTKLDFIENAANEIKDGFLLTFIKSPLVFNTIERDVLLEAAQNFQKDVTVTLHKLLEGIEIGWITTEGRGEEGK